MISETDRNALFAALSEIWSALLGVDVADVSSSTNFFELGGDSLTAVRLVGSISSELGIQMHVRDVFDHPTLDEYVDIVARGRLSA